MKLNQIFFLLGNLLMIIPLNLEAISGESTGGINRADIVIASNATKQEIMAARQLSFYLHDLYPRYLFSVTNVINGNNLSIRLGLPGILLPGESFLKEISYDKEGFIIRRLNEKNVVILSRSDKGLFNAIYSLLEKLGYGFYLSYDIKPLPKKKINLCEWEMSDLPLQSERIVFNWHNFVSGCSGWNYEDWCSWIDQCAKMRYNTIMVHAYGNNPMFSFEHNGLKKEVGYLTTSRSGRDWGAQHVNDVRRLPGGKVFSGPVLGSTAALVPDGQRVLAATNLMSKVFEHADEMAMKINFGVDVDTRSANPKNIIESLPAQCRIKLETQDIVNPETNDGYQYYKAQVKSLLTSYPQIKTITVWARNGRSLWGDIKAEQMPESWFSEWTELLKMKPELAGYRHALRNFTYAKLIKAFKKALIELDRKDVIIAFGSFYLEILPSADILIPEDCPIFLLDTMNRFDSEETKKLLGEVGRNRKVTPIFYGQHDDHRYMGRPFTPFPDFNNLLGERNIAGYGILHWTTRPLDLLFRSLSDQVWSMSENKTLASTVSDYCRSVFGPKQDALNDYMNEWINHGPMFGRETQEHFFDLGKQMFGEKYEPTEVTIERIVRRTGLLKTVSQSNLSDTGKKMYNYCHSMEQFYLSLFQNRDKFNKAYALLGRQSIDSARLILQTVAPEKTIELFAAASTILPITTGEKALIVSMGTRWLPDFVNLKQRARMADICYKFGATQHDELAQQPGTGTYFIDRDKILWSCLGEKELKTGIAGSFDDKEALKYPENSLTYIKISAPFIISLTTIGKDQLVPGRYKVEIKHKASPYGPRCKLHLISENSNVPLQATLQNKGMDLDVISTTIEIKDTQKKSIEIDPGNETKLFTNLVIRPI